jgi:regulatory protein
MAKRELLKEQKVSESAVYKIALAKAMAQCSRREMCISEIQTKLKSWGVVDDDTEKITGILIDENFINEIRYATAFVKDKFNYNKWGKVKITAHLKSKHISSGIITSALDSIDDEVYKKRLNDLISGHRRFVKAKNPYDLKARLLRFGLSKGYESSLLYEMLNEQED